MRFKPREAPEQPPESYFSIVSRDFVLYCNQLSLYMGSAGDRQHALPLQPLRSLQLPSLLSLRSCLAPPVAARVFRLAM